VNVVLGVGVTLSSDDMGVGMVGVVEWLVLLVGNQGRVP
jgi:hypothetical protein